MWDYKSFTEAMDLWQQNVLYVVEDILGNILEISEVIMLE